MNLKKTMQGRIFTPSGLHPRLPEVKDGGTGIGISGRREQQKACRRCSSQIESGRLRAIVTDGPASPSGGLRVELHSKAQGRG